MIKISREKREGLKNLNSLKVLKKIGFSVIHVTAEEWAKCCLHTQQFPVLFVPLPPNGMNQD